MAKRIWEEIYKTVRRELTSEETDMIVNCIESVFHSTKRKVISREWDEYYSFLSQEALVYFWKYDPDRSSVSIEKHLIISLFNRASSFRVSMFKFTSRNILIVDTSEDNTGDKTNLVSKTILHNHYEDYSAEDIEKFIATLSDRDRFIVENLLDGKSRTTIRGILGMSEKGIYKAVDGIIYKAGNYGFSIQKMKRYKNYLKRQQKRGIFK